MRTLNIKSLTQAKIKEAIKNADLSPQKQARMQALSTQLVGALTSRAYSGPQFKELKTRIEDLLVDWGLSASVIGKTSEHATLANLLACGVVMAE